MSRQTSHQIMMGLQHIAMVSQLSRGCDGTLLSFSINVLDSLRLVGVPILTGQDEIAFLHLWRYISYLIGVRDEFNPLTSLNRAWGAVQSVVSHLLDPDGKSLVLAAHMIRSISYRAPYPWSAHTLAKRFYTFSVINFPMLFESKRLWLFPFSTICISKRLFFF
jgi:hypothetical protein